MKRIEKILTENTASKLRRTSKKLEFRRECMQWETTKNPIGPGSDAPVEERSMLSALLRKRLIFSLRELEAPSPKRKGFLMQEKLTSNATDTVLQISETNHEYITAADFQELGAPTRIPSHFMCFSDNYYSGQYPSSYLRAVNNNKCVYSASLPSPREFHILVIKDCKRTWWSSRLSMGSSKLLMTIVILLTPLHPIHCHGFYTITPHSLSWSLHHYNPFIFIVFTPFTNPQPIMLVHLIMASPGRHRQPYYWYILSWHVHSLPAAQHDSSILFFSVLLAT